MVVGVLQVELTIDWAGSLKDKRGVVSSLKDRLHREHQVSVAEVDRMDNKQIAVLGIAMAAPDGARAQSVLNQIVKKLTAARDCVLTDHRIEILTGH